MKILIYPNAGLRSVADNVPKDQESIFFVYDMIDLLDKSKGVGLSATQVGINARVFIMSKRENIDSPCVIIDPKILSHSDKTHLSVEGCLSIPNFTISVKRYNEIEVEYKNINFEMFTEKLTGKEADIFQHELDHLNGVLIIDVLSKKDRIAIVKRLSRRK